MTQGHARRRFRVMQSRIGEFLSEHRVTRAEVAAHLGLAPSGVSRKILGQRPWKLSEIQALIRFLSARLERRVGYDDLFGETPPAAPQDETVGAAS